MKRCLLSIALAYIAWAPAPIAHGQDRVPPTASTSLDISASTGDFQAVTPQSSPAEIASAIQGRLDYLHEKNLGGRVYIPPGRWRIDKPIFMNGDNKAIAGSGPDSILEAADGYRAMPMLNIGARSSYDGRPMQQCNRVPLMDPAARLLDTSVQGQRFGLRTYAEYPSDRFPETSHQALFAPKENPWKKGTLYKAGDVATISAPGTLRYIEAICTQEHTACDLDQPFKGANWKSQWVVKLPFHVQFFADPFSAGAYNPETHRASDWKRMDAFTLDFAYALNASAKLNEEPRMLCGTVMGGESGPPANHVWMLMLHPDGRLTFEMTLADGKGKSFEIAKESGMPGLYRLALQIDFKTGAIDGWLARPGSNAMARTLEDAAALPVGARFNEMEYGFFVIAGGDDGSPSGSNGRWHPPIDITVCGLHMSADCRYARAPGLAPLDGSPAADAFRYFANDKGTMAFLPLTDRPADKDLKTAGALVTVQHGPASGDAGQRGFGYFKAPAGIYGISHPTVCNLTIKPGPVWGAGIVTWHTLDARLSDLDIHGGFYAIGDLFYGAQYTFDIRRCSLSGSEAGFNGSSCIVYMRDVTIDPVGRNAILVSGSNMMLEHVRFGDPQLHRSQYYFRHISSVLYGGMNLLTDVRAEAPAGSIYPSEAAFSQKTIWIYHTTLVLRDCIAANMGPAAAFVDLQFSGGPGNGRILVEKCAYRGAPIAAWIKSDSPWWSGSFSASAPDHSVSKALDLRLHPSPEWKAGATYTHGSLVNLEGAAWLAAADHIATEDNKPGASSSSSTWTRAIPRIAFDRAAE